MADIENLTPTESPDEYELVRHPRAIKRVKANALIWEIAATCLSMLGIAFVVWVSQALGLNALTGGFLFLVVVVFAAAVGGFWSGVITILVATVCFDYFFLPPVHHFDIDDPMDWVALGAFGFTAQVINLAQRQARARAEEAAIARDTTARLYDTARRILLLEGAAQVGNRMMSLIREEFDLAGIGLFDAVEARLFTSGDFAPEARKELESTYLLNSDAYDRPTKTWYCVLQKGGRPRGSLALSGTQMSKL